MKKMKKIILSLLTAFVLAFTVLSVNAAKAATATPYLNVRYETYTVSDYEKKTAYQQYWNADMATWANYYVQLSGITTSLSPGLNTIVPDNAAVISNLDTLWDNTYGMNVMASADPTKTLYDYYGDYPQNLFDGVSSVFSFNVNYTPGIMGMAGTATYVSANLPKVKQTTEFTSTQQIAIEVIINLNGSSLDAASIMIDKSSFASTVTPVYYPNTNLPGAGGTIPTGQSNPYLMFDGQSSTGNELAANTDYSLGAMVLSFDSTASGTQTIKMYNNSTAFAYSAFVDGTTEYRLDASYKHFTETVATFNIKGSSNSTELTSITIDGTTNTIDPSTYIYGTVTADGNTYDEYLTGSSSYSGSSVEISATVQNLGEITGVRYSTTSYANAINISTGTSVAKNATGNYPIPMGGVSTGSYVYVAIDVLASNNITEQTYVLKLQKAYSTVAELSGVSFTASGPITTVQLMDSTGTAAATFAPGTTDYVVAVADNITGLSVSATFDTSVSQKCQISGGGVSLSSPTTQALAYYTHGSTFSIIMTAQDGITTKTYTFTIKHLSTDTSLTDLHYKGASETADHTASLTGTTYTINNIAYKESSFTLEAVYSGTKSVSINSTNLPSGTHVNFGFTASSTAYGAHTETLTITVTAEAGNTATYTVNVNRLAADTDNDIATLVIEDNLGNAIGTFDPATQSFSQTAGDSTNPLDFTITGITATMTVSSTFATYSINGSSVLTKTLNFGTGYTATSQTFTIVVNAENPTISARTITVTVHRKGADNDTTFSITATADFDQDAAGNRSVAMTTSGSNTQNTTQLLYGTTGVTFNITPTASTTRILIGGVDYTGLDYTVSITPTVTSSTQTVSIKIVTEANPSGTTHNVKFITAQANDDHSFTFYLYEPSSPGVAITKDPDSTGNTFKYTLDPAVFTTGKYKLDVTLGNALSSIYTSTDNTNNTTLKANPFSSSDEFSIPTTVLYLSVFSQYGNKTTYTIVVKWVTILDTDNKIADVDLDIDPSFVFSDLTPNYGPISVPYSTTQVVFTITLNASTAVLIQGNSGGAQNLAEGLNTFYVQARAENGDPGMTYTFTIDRAFGRTDDYVTGLSINTINCSVLNTTYMHTAFNQAMNSFDFVFPTTVSLARIKFDVSPGATFEIKDLSTGTSSTTDNVNFPVNLTAHARTQVQIYVRSEVNSLSGGTSNTYTINIYVADQDFTMSNFELYNADPSTGGSLLKDSTNNYFSFNAANTNQGTFVVPYSTTLAYIKATAASSNATISGDGAKTLSPGALSYTVTITSEYQTLNSNITTQTKSYTIIIERELADTNNLLSSLSVKDSTGNELLDQTFVPGQFNYTVANLPDSITTFNLSYTPQSTKSTVTGDGALAPAGADITFATTASGGTTTMICRVEVTSEAGVSQTYTITISRAPVVLDGNFEITNINITDGSGLLYLDKDNVSLSPLQVYTQTNPTYNINIAANVAGVTLVLEKGSPTSTVTINGSPISSLTTFIAVNPGTLKTLRIACIAEDSTANPTIYELNIQRDPYDNDSSLSDLQVNGTTISGFTSSQLLYTVNVPYSVSTVTLFGTPTSSLASVTSNDAPTSSPYTLTPGAQILTITVTAQDPAVTTTYKVTVVRDAVDTLASLFVYDGTGANLISYDGVQTVYSANVPYETDRVNVVATPDGGSLVSVTGTGNISLVEGANVITVEVTTASGVVKPYTITINRATGSNDAYITKYTKEDGVDLPVNYTDLTYTYVLDRSTAYTSFNPTITVSSAATLHMPSIRTLTDGKNQFTVKVESQTGVFREYKFVVYKAENNFAIDDINVLTTAGGTDVVDKDGTTIINYTTGAFTLNVPYATTQVYLEVLLNGSYAIAKVNGATYTNSVVSLTEGANTFAIYALSEYGSLNALATGTTSPTYTITINRDAANTDATLSDLSVVVDGVTYTATAAQLASGELIIENVGTAATTATISATANVPSGVSVTGTGPQSLTAISGASGYVFTFPVVVTPESGPAKTYNVIISRGPLNLDDHNELTYISVHDSTGVYHLDQPTFDPATLTYNISIPYGPNSYTITIHKIAASPALPVGDGHFTISYVGNADYNQSHLVYLVSQNGNPGTQYTINVTCLAPVDDATLAGITVNGVLISGFDPEITVYDLGIVPSTTPNIDLGVVKADPTQVVTGTGVQVLNNGDNTFVLVVISQSGSVGYYTVKVKRDFPDPYLTDLAAVGEALLDTSDKVTAFNKDINTYHVIVPYLTVSLTINASVDNTDYNVSCSNSTAITTTGNVRSFGVNLNEGTNTFTIIVQSLEGKTVSYTLIVQRRSQSSANTNISKITIPEIPGITIDYSNLINVYRYEVENRIDSLSVEVVCEKIKDAYGDGATYQVFNNEYLKVGENQVIILVTAEDGETTRAVILYVTRKAMDFTVDKEATVYECSEVDGKPDTYVINLGEDDATAISDYTRYIKFTNDYDLDVEVLTEKIDENCKEVILKVTDGYEERFIKLQLETIEETEYTVGWPIWLALAIAVGLLLVILISVNRDKYGSVSRRRKLS